MSTPKEIDYFNFDRIKRYKDNLARYEGFFAGATDKHIVVGEASTAYLRSDVAVEEILRYAPEAKFAVCLRNPVEMAISWHNQAINEAWENELDFERAWRLQDERRMGRHVPWLCPDVRDLLYGDVCRVGAQMVSLDYCQFMGWARISPSGQTRWVHPKFVAGFISSEPF